MENVFLFFHWYCIRVVCGKQTSCGWIFWTWPNTGENACVTFAWFASDFLPNWIRALMQQIELIFTCYCSCHRTNMMSFWNGKGSLLAFFFPFLCAWISVVDRGGQNKQVKRNEVLSSVPIQKLPCCCSVFAEFPALLLSLPSEWHMPLSSCLVELV